MAFGQYAMQVIMAFFDDLYDVYLGACASVSAERIAEAIQYRTSRPGREQTDPLPRPCKYRILEISRYNKRGVMMGCRTFISMALPGQTTAFIGSYRVWKVS